MTDAGFDSMLNQILRELDPRQEIHVTPKVGVDTAARAIAYGGQLAGIAAAALLETLTEEEDED